MESSTGDKWIDSSKEPKWTPEILVLGPGGVKGFGILGMLLSYEEKGILDQIQGYGGVSIGALISLLLCCGYTIIDILSEANDSILPEFPDISSMYDLPIWLSKWKKGEGLLSINRLRDRLKVLLESRFGVIPTFQQLYMATGKELLMVSYDLDADRPYYLSRKHTPDIPVDDAVIYSMSIPLILERSVYNGKYLIDGAFGNPYPVNMFPEEKKVLGIFVLSETPPSGSSLISLLWKVIHAPIHQLKNLIQ